MAERRMFSSKIVCSDAFTGMPFSAQALYVQLCMEADDDGFLNRAKRIQGSIGASDADLDLLFAKRFILGFDNGVIAVKHWRMNNQIRKDRYTPTQYQDEFETLEIKKDGSYTERVKKEAVDTLATKWQPNGNQMATQYRLGKDSIVEDSADNIYSTPEPSEKAPQKPAKRKCGEFKHVLLTDAEFEKLEKEYGAETRYQAIKFLDEYIEEKGYKSKSHYLAIRRWVVDAINKQGKGGGGSYPTTNTKTQPKSEYDAFMDKLKGIHERAVENGD